MAAAFREGDLVPDLAGLPGQWEPRLAELRADTVSSATSLAVRAARWYATWAMALPEAPADLRRDWITRAALALPRAQPAMAPMVNLANAILQEASGAAADPVEFACHAALAFAQQVEGNLARVAQAAARLIPPNSCALTISYSSAVLEALRAAAPDKGPLRCYCLESRPLLEGRTMAAHLAEAGIQATVAVDTAAASLLPACDLVLVGADSVSPAGVVNKIGTLGLALAAREAGVPFYVLCGSEKLLPLPVPDHAGPDRDPKEVYPEAPPGVQVWNRYFDLTPLSLLTAIVGEDGVSAPDDLASKLSAMALHPALRSMLEKLD